MTSQKDSEKGGHITLQISSGYGMEPIEMDAEFDYTLYSSCKTATFINDIN
jgi:hypothetical protein